MDFYNILEETGIIAILRGVPEDSLEKALDAIYDGGVRLAEITFEAECPEHDRKTAAIIKKAVKYVEGRMLIGAGTVIRPEQVEFVKAAGGKFIISPNTDTEIIKSTKAQGLISLPGAMTISEIVTANSAGADFVKIFPASVLGKDFIKQVKGPLPHIKLLAVSGISPTDVEGYIASGSSGFGIGSAIVNTKLCLQNNFTAIKENAESYTQAYKHARGAIK